MPTSRHDLPASARRREILVGICAGVVAIGALGVGSDVQKFHSTASHAKLVEWLAVVGLLLAGGIAVRRTASVLGRIITRQSVQSAGAVVRLVATGIGYVIILFAIFAVLGVSLQHLLIGAGVAGVALGIAAQQSLANIFASLVLLFARPFGVGDRIRIRSGSLGVIDVWVVGIGLTYVTVRNDEGVMKIPNSAMLASGIGQLPTDSEATHLESGDADGGKEH
jgi:small-conductance mechanosensitive channel